MDLIQAIKTRHSCLKDRPVWQAVREALKTL